jgi:hypothetical protein
MQYIKYPSKWCNCKIADINYQLPDDLAQKAKVPR